jgi:hypothetical protein
MEKHIDKGMHRRRDGNTDRQIDGEIKKCRNMDGEPL